MTIRIYKDAQKQWRWSLADKANGKILADSGQGYSRKIDCVRGMERVTNAALISQLQDDILALLDSVKKAGKR